MSRTCLTSSQDTYVTNLSQAEMRISCHELVSHHTHVTNLSQVKSRYSSHELILKSRTCLTSSRDTQVTNLSQASRDTHVTNLSYIKSRYSSHELVSSRDTDGVATILRPLQNIGLFCKRALYKNLYSAKETYNFKEPTNRSHPPKLHYVCKKSSRET